MDKYFIKEPFRILIADDDAEDVEFAKSSFAANNLPVAVSEINDGLLLIDLLKNEYKSKDKKLPQLILLDLNLPGKHGFEALKEIKADKDLCRIPIVMFTSSNSAKNIEKAYELGANCYVTKPTKVTDWNETIGHLGRFWIQCVTLSNLNV